MQIYKSDDFKIIIRQQMNGHELADVKELESICNSHEGLTLKLNWGMLQDRQSDNKGSNESNDFLCYGPKGKLVGFLALYGFGGPEVEISGMVHLSWRRTGVFSHLIGRAAEECSPRGIKSFLFICERKSGSGMAFLKSKGAIYDHSEHRMALSGAAQTVPIDSSPVELRIAAPGDCGMLAELDAVCFGRPMDDTKNRFYQNTLLSSNQQFVITFNGSDIGMIRLEKENDDMLIYGFGIKPEFRGKGYGKKALAKAVNMALLSQPANVALEVDCVNDAALNLYRSCGFETTSTYDYYRLSI